MNEIECRMEKKLPVEDFESELAIVTDFPAPL